MYRRSESCFQAYKIIPFLLCISLFASSCSSDDEIRVQNVIFDLPYESYSDNGVLHIVDNIAFFTDRKTGYDIALCSKPNCSHKRSSFGYSSTCDAFLGPDPCFLFTDNEYIYFITAPDVLDAETIMFDKILYRADMDGRNREEICKLDGIQRPRCMAYQDGMIALGYQKIMNKATSGNEGFSDMEKTITGVMLIDINTGEKKIIKEIEGFSANIYQVYFYENKLFYYMFCTASDTKKNSIDDFEDINKYYDYLLSNYRQKVFLYDPLSGNEETVWEGFTEFVNRQSGGYLIIDYNDKSVFFKGNQIVATYGNDQLSEHKPDFINKYVYEDVLYMADEKRLWSMDIKSGEIKAIAEGKLDGLGINRVIGIFDNTVYFQIIRDGRSGKYMIDKDGFFDGDIEKAIKLYEDGR